MTEAAEQEKSHSPLTSFMIPQYWRQHFRKNGKRNSGLFRGGTKRFLASFYLNLSLGHRGFILLIRLQAVGTFKASESDVKGSIFGL
jgi:hypothetical protein